MNVNKDELQRQLSTLQREHDDAMPKWRAALNRLLMGDKETPGDAKADALLGGFNRRKFLVLGGATAAAAVLAACGDDSDDGNGTATSGDDDAGGGTKTDITVARTAASLEVFAVAVYDAAIQNAAAIKIPADVGKAAGIFRNQHDEHAKAFNAAVEQMGGEPFTDPNPKALETFKATVDAVSAGKASAADVLKFAHDLEAIAAQTYQGVGVNSLSTPALRQTAMSVGGVEARHQAVLAMFIDGLESVPAAFQPTDQAVTAEFFV